MTTDARPAISVDAVGAAAGTPDVVLLTLGVETAAAAPGPAMRAAASAASALGELLGANGVAEGDRQTSHVSVQPVFDHQRQVVSHHQATYLYDVMVRDLDAAGTIVDQASGADELAEVLRVRNIALGFSDSEALLAEARRRAVLAARRQAEQLASAAGVALGPLRTLSEGSPPASIGRMQLVARPQRAAAVEPGTSELLVRVHAVYDIADQAPA